MKPPLKRRLLRISTTTLACGAVWLAAGCAASGSQSTPHESSRHSQGTSGAAAQTANSVEIASADRNAVAQDLPGEPEVPELLVPAPPGVEDAKPREDNRPSIRRNPPAPMEDVPENPRIDERFLFDSELLRGMVPLTVQDFPDLDEAEAHFDAIGEEARSEYMRASLLNQTGYTTRAYEHFRAAVERDPENLWLKLRAAQAAVFLNDLPSARRYAEEVLEIEPDNYRAMLLMAQIQTMRERLPEATEWYEKVIEVRPLNIEALENLARIAYRNQDLEAVKEYASAIFEVTSRNLTAILLHAEASALTGDIRYASELYAQLLRYRPSLISQVEDMGLRLIRQGRTDEALELFRQGVAIQPGSRRIREVWEESLRQLRSEEAVREGYEALAAENRLDLRIQELYANYLERIGDTEALREQRRRMLEIEPRHVASLLSIAKLELEEGNLEEANELFEQALAAGPRQGETYREIALVYMDQDNLDRAEELLRSAYALDPENVETFMAMAAVADMREDNDAVEKHLKDALDAAPGHPVVLEYLGKHYQRLGEWGKASAVFEQALASTPTDQQVQLQLARAYLEQNAQRSLDALERDRSFARPGYAFYSGYGLLAMEYGEYNRARWSLERALEETPGAIGLIVALAQSYVHLGEARLAEDTLERGHEHYPETDSGQRQYHLNLMWVLSSSRQFDRAAELAEELKSEWPDDPAIVGLYFDALRENGETDRIRRELDDATAAVAEADPVEAARMRARVIARLGQNREALEILYALEAEAEGFEPTIVFDIAFNYSDLEDVENATKYYTRLMEELSEEDDEHFWIYVNAHNNLAYMYAKQNIRLEEALALSGRALELKPRAEHILDTYGYTLFRLGEYEEAERHMRLAEKISLPDPEIFENLGDLFRATDRPAQALEYYERALALIARDDADGLQAKIDELQTLLGAAR